jgi:hypothetical protein
LKVFVRNCAVAEYGINTTYSWRTIELCCSGFMNTKKAEKKPTELDGNSPSERQQFEKAPS